MGQTRMVLCRRLILSALAAAACLQAAAQTRQVEDWICSDGWTYTGQMVAGKRHGYGSAISKKGNFYTGDWVDNLLPSGLLVADDGNGNKWEYEGEFNASFSPHGFGTVRYTAGKNAGDTYIGNFRNGNKQGLGLYITAAGKRSYGNWAAGVLSLPKGHSFKIGESVYGIDISRYQRGIDWDNLAIYCDSKGRVHDGNKKEIESRKYVQPVSFVYIKASESNDKTDSLYASHMAAARRHKVPAGSYHMMQFTDVGAEAQAANFLKAAANCQNDELPPGLDLEYAGQAGRMGKERVMKMVLSWLKTVEKKTGRKPVIYTNDNFASRFLDLNRLKGYTLWISRYNVEEPSTHPWYIWQFTEKGRVSGYRGDVDINYYDGRYHQFERRMLR